MVIKLALLRQHGCNFIRRQRKLPSTGTNRCLINRSISSLGGATSESNSNFLFHPQRYENDIAMPHTRPPCSASAISTRNFSLSRKSSSQNNPDRVPINLYRQLLSWCRKYNDVPFDSLPPVPLSPPLVDLKVVKHIRDMRSLLETSQVKQLMNEYLSIFDNGRTFGHPAQYVLYNDDIIIKENLIIFPELRTAHELRAMIRSIFWMNNKKSHLKFDHNVSTSPNAENNNALKEQVALAFEAIKSCNQLSTELDNRRNKRQLSITARRKSIHWNPEHVQDRQLALETEHLTDCTPESQSSASPPKDAHFPTVEFHVGEVVQHKKHRWRGVVVGWDVEEDKRNGSITKGQRTSLTTKQYSLSSNDDKPDPSRTPSETHSLSDCSKVKYTILIDVNDASIIGSPKFASREPQEDLLSVSDPCLQRIHNNVIKQHFTKFDAKGHFAPNDILTYMYPLDRFSVSDNNARNKSDNASGDTKVIPDKTPSMVSPPELEKVRLAIKNGVQDIGQRLLPCMADLDMQQVKKEEDIDAKEFNKPHSASSFISLSQDIHSIAQSGDLPAIASLGKLYHFHLKIGSLMWAREFRLKHRSKISFSLGQIVKHKLYGYRGVIVAWDHKPSLDVSNWDGLQGIENPNEKPFYHIRPDVNDCIRVFGGPRNFRYVCEDNLEAFGPTTTEQKETDTKVKELGLKLEVELDSQEWLWDSDKGRYSPSDEIKFVYGERLGEDDEIIVSCIENIRKTLAECFLNVRRVDKNEHFTMDDLFYLLQSAETLEEATIVQDTIKEIWKECPNYALRNQLDSGIADLISGENEKALRTFSSIVESDPTYGEAWNKKATAHYMMGEVKESLEAAKKALEIEPRNFQALAGVGLVEMDSSNFESAIAAFRQSLRLNPWSMVSSRLCACLGKV